MNVARTVMAHLGRACAARRHPCCGAPLFAALALRALPCFSEAAAIAPKFLDAEPAKIVCDAGVTVTREDGRLRVECAPNSGEWPGFSIVPEEGFWDLSQWGHFEVTGENLSDMQVCLGLRIDNAGDWTKNPWNSENLFIGPGETKVGRVIFGYQYGFQKGYRLDPSKVSQVKVFFCGNSDKKRTVVVSGVSAAGPAKEKPPKDPASMVWVPEKGEIVAEPVAAEDGAVELRPPSGWWSFAEGLKLVVAVRNTGAVPIFPTVSIESAGQTISVDAKDVKPGKTEKVEVSFMPEKPWYSEGGAYAEAEPGHAWKFDSHRVRRVTVDALSGAQFTVVSARVEDVVAKPPRWLGKRPPVEGKWRKTFVDEFNGKEIDSSKWNIYADNYWDSATHFTKDNIFIRDGKLVLKYEQKRGRHNDDPEGKLTDFACGFADTYGKFTQRYGYFETRLKLPRCPGLWPAFWMMPDRGADKGPQWVRAATEDGGMEFDIMEHLTAWGPHRFNIAWHWDGYGKGHKSIGTVWAYMPADKEGFMTVGLLWLPGEAAVYGNGVELARWKNPRVGDQPSNFLIDIVQGGWANDPLDEDQLPDELVLDYVRVWQRDDL